MNKSTRSVKLAAINVALAEKAGSAMGSELFLSNALRALGFVREGTGGGCTAWIRRDADGDETYITDGDLSAPNKLDDPCEVARKILATEEFADFQSYTTVRDYLNSLR